MEAGVQGRRTNLLSVLQGYRRRILKPELPDRPGIVGIRDQGLRALGLRQRGDQGRQTAAGNNNHKDAEGHGGQYHTKV